MGRLELAGIDPATTPPARFWRALWTLLVEYKTSVTEEADQAIRGMWATLAGADAGAAPSGTDAVEPSPPPRPAAPARPAAAPRFDPPIDPDTGRPRRPTAAERHAWAVQHGMAGPNDLMGAGGRSGAADKVGGR